MNTGSTVTPLTTATSQTVQPGGATTTPGNGFGPLLTELRSNLSLLGSSAFTIGGGVGNGSFVGLGGTATTGVSSASILPTTNGGHIVGASNQGVGGALGTELFSFTRSSTSGSGIFTVQNILGTGGVTGAALTSLQSVLNANVGGAAFTELEGVRPINPLFGFHPSGGHG